MLERHFADLAQAFGDKFRDIHHSDLLAGGREHSGCAEEPDEHATGVKVDSRHRHGIDDFLEDVRRGDVESLGAEDKGHTGVEQRPLILVKHVRLQQLDNFIPRVRFLAAEGQVRVLIQIVLELLLLLAIFCLNFLREASDLTVLKEESFVPRKLSEPPHFIIKIVS